MAFVSALCFFQNTVWARIYIDINAPAVDRIKIAIPDFRNLSSDGAGPQFASDLPQVLSNDLDLSGYFNPIEKAAFLSDDVIAFTAEQIRFKDWSTIGADLLVKGGYSVIGQSLEVEVRLFDVFRGHQILGKRIFGRTDDYRGLMHRLGNDVVYLLTGQKGIFLSKLAFVGTATGHKEIYVSDYDGHNVKQITKDKSIALLPKWSPEGDKLFYNSYKEGGGPALYLFDIVTGKTTKVSARDGLNIGAAWAPDGKSAALCLSMDGEPDIYRIDLTGKILQRITKSWDICVSPTFSPDGSKIAFVSNRAGSPQIYVRELPEGREDRITFEGKYNTSPTWSVLNRIAFTGSEEGLFNIFTVDTSGRDLRNLTVGQGDNEDPCWSPNGRYIAFSSSRAGAYHIYIMTGSGRNQRRITFLKGEQTSPSWSP
ncbi:MAG: Tol-Pal system beta propeller repeat protein TolB [Deltaproteobacteria bacterium]|nr:Tol-Pal system beta propeller repeat protein TolB [Deltaproteobacteria bacterium]